MPFFNAIGLLLLFEQLKMRTGGVDPSRISKRKRSPKSRSKRSHHLSAPPTLDSSAKTVPVSNVPEQVDTMVTNTDMFEHVPFERLATTPGYGEGEGLIDITQSFQVSCFLVVM